MKALKRTIYGVLLVLALYGVFMSRWNVFTTFDKRDSLLDATTRYTMAQSNLEVAKQDFVAAQNEFNSKRTFEIAYSDINRIVTVLNNVAGVTVSAVNVADPEQYFVTGSAWEEGMEAKAISISLVVDDTSSALVVIGRMELPIYSIVVSEPNIVNMIFLTGGDI